MADYNRINNIIRAAVLSKPEKIAICPFAEAGMMGKQILNLRYGVDETYIIDNKLSELNPKILSVADLKDKDYSGLMVLLLIENKEIIKSLRKGLESISEDIIIQDYYSPACVYGETNAEYIRKLKELFRVKKATGQQFVRLGRSNDGGYVLLDDFEKVTTAYSFGISNDVSFEKALADRDIVIHMYDHTINGLPQNNYRFRYEHLGIAGADDSENCLLSLPTLIDKNGDAEKENMILKIDVEGAEWDVIDATPSEIFDRFAQISFELHHLVGSADKDKVLRCLEKLNTTHQLIWAHGNNFGHYAKSGNIVMPDYLEVTYVNKKIYETVKAECVFPRSIDMPCCSDIEEIELGDWG